MPITYLPPSHDRPPPQPASPTSAPTHLPTLPRSRSSQLSIPLYTTPPSPRSLTQRRRSSAITDLDQEEIKTLSERAKEAERRAQWEGSKLLNLEPPITPPRPRPTIARSKSSSSSSSSTANSNFLSLYETPSNQVPRSPISLAPRSPRSRDPSRGASSIYSSHSNLDAVSEFLQDQEPASSSPRSPSFATRPVARPSTASSSSRSSLLLLRSKGRRSWGNGIRDDGGFSSLGTNRRRWLSNLLFSLN